MQVRIRGETLALQAKWRRVQQRLPCNTPDRGRAAAVSRATSPASSDVSEEAAAEDTDDTAAVAAVVAGAPEPGGQRVVQPPRLKSVARSVSPQATTTVTVSLGGAHAPDGDVNGAVTSPALAGLVAQAAGATDDCEPETPEPPRKKGRSAATDSPVAGSTAAGESTPATAAADNGVLGGEAADHTPKAPHAGLPPLMMAPQTSGPPCADDMAPALEQGYIVVAGTSLASSHNAASGGVSPAGGDVLASMGTILAASDGAMPARAEGDRAAHAHITPSAALCELAVPETVTPRLISAPRRRKKTKRNEEEKNKQTMDKKNKKAKDKNSKQTKGMKNEQTKDKKKRAKKNKTASDAQRNDKPRRMPHEQLAPAPAGVGQ